MSPLCMMFDRSSQRGCCSYLCYKWFSVVRHLSVVLPVASHCLHPVLKGPVEACCFLFGSQKHLHKPSVFTLVTTCCGEIILPRQYMSSLSFPFSVSYFIPVAMVVHLWYHSLKFAIFLYSQQAQVEHNSSYNARGELTDWVSSPLALRDELCSTVSYVNLQWCPWAGSDSCTLLYTLIIFVLFLDYYYLFFMYSICMSCHIDFVCIWYGNKDLWPDAEEKWEGERACGWVDLDGYKRRIKRKGGSSAWATRIWTGVHLRYFMWKSRRKSEGWVLYLTFWTECSLFSTSELLCLKTPVW